MEVGTQHVLASGATTAAVGPFWSHRRLRRADGRYRNGWYEVFEDTRRCR